MKELCMMIGLPASGKSTQAKARLHDHYKGNAVIVNRDQLRLMLHDGKWSKGKENTTMAVRDAIIQDALNRELSVIVDDTNLNPKVQSHLSRLAELNGAKMVPFDMTHVPLETCLERDKKRPNYVGEKVIRDTYNRYLRNPVEPAPVNHKLPWCVIVDIDGSIATMENRGPFEWSKVGQDKPRHHVMDAAMGIAMHGNDKVVFFSGRDSVCRTETVMWLIEKFGIDVRAGDKYALYMRPEGDQRKDVIIKKELYEAHILGKLNVRGIVDDRMQVCRGWRDLGLGDRLFRVGVPDEDDF